MSIFWRVKGFNHLVIKKISILRFYSSLQHNTVEAKYFKFKNDIVKKKWTIEDDLSLTHASKLMKMLNSIGFDNEYKLKMNGVLPIGYNFIFFNPVCEEKLIGDDGYDNYQAPIAIDSSLNGSNRYKQLFKRRLWVGGKLIIKGENHFLRLNDFSECIEKVSKIKRFKYNEDKIDYYITIDRKIFNSNNDNCLQETRKLYYTSNLNNNSNNNNNNINNNNNNSNNNNNKTKKIKISEIFLFRFSSLTFNSHKIHYNLKYCSEIEKIPKLIIHGPLLILIMIRYFVNNEINREISEEYKFIQSISYKNRYPSYVDDEISLKYKINDVVDGGTSKADIWIENSAGVICADCKILFSSKNSNIP
ncbi:hydroxyacyl-thioester dehydratase HTD2 ASCRUDRAFT_71658 [Ascoidea rubescens DSM 1968]|uniref:Thioesterase/thiol ester dehydrase-isomerase n=1 Tax=Ascoidea rubescens DSM 1968 TaxID=1344418 RepID=A0A1D2VDE7_9ASCO|nr:hypothetical protein ASCRUDRAFT_71658 [Ascoidea rubescens DSM 1968]ODV59728.1 hypothetical protein ASCRUDRAFT_71658 [Ascoidea rubescens DSM 1968]